MGCGMGMIKYMLFIFNFIFAVCGLAILIVGVVIHLNVAHAADKLSNVAMPSITLIVIGSIIFVISFFGCCGAIRESHCMIVTFACFLLVILIIQVAIGIYVLVASNNISDDSTTIKNEYTKIFMAYGGSDEGSTTTIDTIQVTLTCCGVESSADYGKLLSRPIPGSCCGKTKDLACNSQDIYTVGCVQQIQDMIKYMGSVLGGVALGIAAVELCGIVFALCLANAIKNAERRGYRV